MAVKIVTDSTSDIPPQLIKELDISVVPVYVQIGNKFLRDGIDISHDEIYDNIREGSIKTTTSQPNPQDFADVYQKLSQDSTDIISIQLISDLSGTYNSALQGKEMTKSSVNIEVVDSRSLSMGLGLITIAAAKMAKEGKNMAEIMKEVKSIIPNVKIFALLDTLKYVLQSGRLDKASSLLGNLLNVKPMLTLKNGHLAPTGISRTRKKGLDCLFDMVKKARHPYEISIVQSTNPDEATTLKEHISSLVDKSRIYLSRLGPTLGSHSGPGTLVLAIREKMPKLNQKNNGKEEYKKNAAQDVISLPKFFTAHHPTPLLD
jgi:DegV family protein with EDD domain